MAANTTTQQPGEQPRDTSYHKWKIEVAFIALKKPCGATATFQQKTNHTQQQQQQEQQQQLLLLRNSSVTTKPIIAGGRVHGSWVAGLAASRM
jgi:hypothetical protein